MAGRGCIKKGCLGCAALLAILLVALILFLIVALIAGPRDARIEPVETSHPVTISPAEAGAGAAAAGRIVLEVGMLEIDVVPGEPGQSITLEGSYDEARYRLDETWKDRDDGSWEYRVRFATRGIGMHLFSYDARRNRNRLRLRIPPDVPLELVGELGVGKSEIELGGSAVQEVDLDYGAGEHRVAFSSPTERPMRSLRLKGSIGEFEVDGVGNASPADVDVSQRIGELSLDLRGDWTTDSTARVRCGIGECSVRAPRDVTLISDVDVMLGEVKGPGRKSGPDEIGTPTVTLVVRGTIGEVSVTR